MNWRLEEGFHSFFKLFLRCDLVQVYQLSSQVICDYLDVGCLMGVDNQVPEGVPFT